MYALTPEAIILSVMILAESVFIFFLLRHKDQRGAKELALFAFIISLHNLVYAFETMAVSYETKVFWDTLQYITILWSPLILLHLSNRYFNLKVSRIGIYYIIFASLSVVLTLVIASSQFHPLFIAERVFAPGVFTVNRYMPHIFLYVFNLYVLFGGLLYLYFSFYMMVTERGIFRRRGMLMMMMLLIPVTTVFIYVLMKSSITFYYTPFAYFAGLLFPKYLMVTGRLFGPVPLEGRSVLDSLLDGVVIVDRNGVILDYNKRAGEYIPQLTDECVGLSMEEASFDSPILKAMCDLDSSYTGNTESVITSEDSAGHVRSYEIARTYDLNTRHRLHASVLTLRDVTELKSMEIELSRRYERMKEDNRMKGLLLEVISHDIRSPLILMKGLRSLMAGGITPNDAGIWTRGGDDLDRLIDRADTLIGNLLPLNDSFDEHEIYDLDTMEVSELITLLQETLKRMGVKKKVRISSPQTKEGLILSHPDLLKSVLRNIIENAVRHSPEESEIVITSKADKDHVHIFVENTGTPISVEALTAVTEGRWGVALRDSSGERGAGIGLYASALFMKKMKGSLGIERLEEGTRASLTFLKQKSEENTGAGV